MVESTEPQSNRRSTRTGGKRKRLIWIAAAAATAGLGYQIMTGGAPAARDGDLELVANEVTCGLERVGPADASRTPTGQYCKVTVTVRNHATTARQLYDYEQVAFDQEGREYRPDLVAGQRAEPAEQHLRFLSPIEPGDSVSGALVYDLPVDMDLTQIRVRESVSSPGTMLSLD